MLKLKNLLYAFVYSPSIDNRLNLAEEYFNIKQYAGALSYYLQVSEFTTDKNLQYYCLIRCAQCFEIPGNRKHSIITLYKHAINILPDRPEAYYYLSRNYEWAGDWFDCYMLACLGLEKSNINDLYTKKLGYQGTYVLLFQKALSAWWIGRGQECRELYQTLIHDYNKVLDYEHKQLITKNAVSLGSGPLHIAHVPYNRYNNKLKYSFLNSEIIEHNYSQVCQDLFVLTVLNGKTNGTYLEIGSGDPTHLNNTYLLESKFNWTGTGIEWKKELADKYKLQRKNEILCVNALEVNYTELLSKINNSGVIDYLQLDCEPSSVTYDIMTKIPFDSFVFRVITYEHDHYVDVTLEFREKSRKFLEKLGYELVVNDVAPTNKATFEDWWVHPDYTDRAIVKKLKTKDPIKITNIREYMFDG